MSRSAIIVKELDHFFREVAPLADGDGVLVAFSGGPDSTVLLQSLVELRETRDFRLAAAHLDHALDPDSGRRAEQAEALAGELGVEVSIERLPTPGTTGMPRGLEDWARSERYDFLERHRQLRSMRYIATGHHRDDQIETLLLRLLFGSGLAGMAGIRPRRGSIVRPLLAFSRRNMAASLETSGLEVVHDPSNADVDRPRNLLRSHLLPYLIERDNDLPERVLAVGRAARRAVGVLEKRLKRHLGPREESGGASIDLARFLDLPAPLRSFALALLHRAAGLTYPAARTARDELGRQITTAGEIGCDCGENWYWKGDQDRLRLQQREPPAHRFTYTLLVPGELDIPEINVRFSVRREPVAPWMFEGRQTRVALNLPVDSGDKVTVRSRRDGDRIQPLGCHYSRRLKEVLIDRRMPRTDRDRLPLLCVGERIAWVPGVTIDNDFRISSDSQQAWVARIEPIQGMPTRN